MMETEKELKEKKKDWEEQLIVALIENGREYEPFFFAEMLIKILWSLQE